MRKLSKKAKRLIIDYSSAAADLTNKAIRPNFIQFGEARAALMDYIAELEKALNIDTDLTIAGLRKELRDATARIAKLEAENDQLTAHSDIERQDDKSFNDTQTQTFVYRKESEE